MPDGRRDRCLIVACRIHTAATAPESRLRYLNFSSPDDRMPSGCSSLSHTRRHTYLRRYFSQHRDVARTTFRFGHTCTSPMIFVISLLQPFSSHHGKPACGITEGPDFRKKRSPQITSPRPIPHSRPPFCGISAKKRRSRRHRTGRCSYRTAFSARPGC